MFKSFFKKKRFFKVGQNLEFQDVFTDLLGKEKEILKDRKFEMPISQRKFFLIFCFILLVFGFFWIDAFYLQIIKGDFYKEKAFNNKTRVYFERPDRGVFYDKNDKQLVWNNSSFDLICDQRDMPYLEQERDVILEGLADVLEVDKQEIENIFEKAFDYQVLIKENVSQDFLVKFSLKSEELKGCYLEENKTREYYEGLIFSHILGYLSKIDKPELEDRKDYSISDYIGKMGIEKKYEEILRGTVGKIIEEKDSFGRTKNIYKEQEAVAGKSLKLWVDSNIQKKSFEALQKSLDNVESLAGSVVVLDVKTGGVLSLVSLPSYDNNLFAKGISQKDYDKLIYDENWPLYNRAISGLYPSGSTIKPLIALAGLEEGIISDSTVIDCKGEINVQNPYDEKVVYKFPDWKIHGITDLKKAIAESCNVFFYLVGGGYKNFEGLGVDRIGKYLHLFGWGEITGIDLFGELKGLIPSPEWKEENKNEIWYPGDTYHLSIGQGDILATPLQIANSFVAIANDGILYRPQLVSKIIDSSSKEVVYDNQPEIIRENFINRDNIKKVKEGMESAVSSPAGSSHSLNTLPVRVGAKTGTAQFGPKGKYHSWITVFAPYENPEIVITVIVENVSEGRVAAIPVAKEILEWYYNK